MTGLGAIGLPSPSAQEAPSTSAAPASTPPQSTGDDPASASPARARAAGQQPRAVAHHGGRSDAAFAQLLESPDPPGEVDVDRPSRRTSAGTAPDAPADGRPDALLVTKFLGLVAGMVLPAGAPAAPNARRPAPGVGATATTAPAPGPAALSQDLQASLRAVVAVVGQPVPMETLATRPPTPDAAPAAAPATLRDTKRDTAPVLSEGMAGGPMLLALQSPAVDPMQAPHPKEQGAVQAPAAGVDALASAVVPAPPTPGSESRAMSPIPLPHPQAPAAGYGDELGASVVWMAEQRIGHAELQVAPDHLGPVEVRLQIDGAHVRAEFYSAQPDVRHALEATLPRLRDMLGQHGLQLGHAGVGQRDQQASQPRSQSPGQEEPGIQSTSGDGVARFRHASVVRGLLDEYA